MTQICPGNIPLAHQPYTTNNTLPADLPLLGIKLCCTSIPPERRSLLASAAITLGATHSLDLTSDVTHLLVGDINTPKYAYVARERPDIHVLRPEFIDAVLLRWQAGADDTELGLNALEKEYKCPTFWGLKVCVTGFDDFEERGALVECVRGGGGMYSGDLTKDVTHLVAKEARGKKFEAAVHWGLKVVGVEWVERSVVRGMALEERLFSVLLPVEERGIGAVKEVKVEGKAELGKRGRDGEAVVQGKRKMRRVATETLEERKDEVWADIGGRHAQKEVTREVVVKQEDTVDETNPVLELEQQDTVKRIFESDALQDFSGKFIVYGFDKRKTDIMHNFLISNGATIIERNDSTHHTDEQAVVVLVPHSTPAAEIQKLQFDLPIRTRVVSEWWVEKCLHEKTLIDESQTPLSQPLRTAGIPGFERLVVCPTSFSGIDLLHFSKAVKLMGAKYDETLRSTTSVLICNEAAKLNVQKLEYAVGNSIPVVSSQWFYESMNQGRILPFAEFCIAGGRGGGGGAAAASSSTRKTDNTKIFWHPVHNPRPQRREGRKLVRDVKGDETSRVAGKDLKDAHVVQRDRDGGGLVRDKAEIVQEPLKDLPPEQNSPKKVVRERQQQHGLGKQMPFVDDDDDNDDDDDDGDECLVQKKESESPTIRQQDEDHGFYIVDHPEMLDERKEGAEAEDDEEDTLAVVENSILHIGDNDNSADERVPMPTMPSDSPFVSIKETNNNNNNITQSKRKEKERESAPPLTTTTTATTTSTQKQARLHRDISDILTNHLKRTTTTTSTDSVSDVAESPTETSMPTSVTAQQHPRKHRPLGRAPSNPTSLLIRNSTTASNDSTSSSHRAANTSTSTSASHPNPIPGGHIVEIDEIDALLHAQHRRHIDTSAEVFRPSQALSYEDPEAVKLKQGVWRQLGMTGLDGVVEGEDEGRVVGIGVVKDRVRERGDAAAGGGGGGRSMRSRTGRKGKGG